jgi:hypothetical protein
MSDASAHIGAWEAAGLIDHATADRLRAAEVDAAELPDAGEDTSVGGPRSAAAAMFGPGVTIPEVFGYLGGAFLVAAWSAFMARTAGSSANSEVALGIMALIAAAALAGLGSWLRGRGERATRAAGVAFLVATSYAAAAAASFGSGAGIEWPTIAVVSAAAALAVAAILRMLHPSVLTEVGVLVWLTALAASGLAWIQSSFFADTFADDTGSSGPDPMLLVVGSAAWWLATAVVIGLIGLGEARFGERTDDPASMRRAAVSRFWAGLVAVIGLAMAVSRSAPLPTGEYGRVLEPWIGILAMLILSAVLLERAFRRDATSYVYAAALGLIVALTDLNVSYLSADTEIALLIEGLILLGVGVAADRLRRRVGGFDDEPPAAPPPTVPLEPLPGEPPDEPVAQPL